MDAEYNSKINDVEFPGISEFVEDDNRYSVKAIPFREVETQKV